MGRRNRAWNRFKKKTQPTERTGVLEITKQRCWDKLSIVTDSTWDALDIGHRNIGGISNGGNVKHTPKSARSSDWDTIISEKHSAWTTTSSDGEKTMYGGSDVVANTLKAESPTLCTLLVVPLVAETQRALCTSFLNCATLVKQQRLREQAVDSLSERDATTLWDFNSLLLDAIRKQYAKKNKVFVVS